MQNQPSSLPKPVTEFWRPDWVALPRLTPARRIFRHFAQLLLWLIALFTMKAKVSGMENFPKKGPALILINHLGDADAVLLGACIPYPIDTLAKIELHEHPAVGRIFRAFGVIWIHRGRPDRRALHAVIEGLAEGRVILLLDALNEMPSANDKEYRHRVRMWKAWLQGLHRDHPGNQVVFCPDAPTANDDAPQRQRIPPVTQHVSRVSFLEHPKNARSRYGKSEPEFPQKMPLDIPTKGVPAWRTGHGVASDSASITWRLAVI